VPHALEVNVAVEQAKVLGKVKKGVELKVIFLLQRRSFFARASLCMLFCPRSTRTLLRPASLTLRRKVSLAFDLVFRCFVLSCLSCDLVLLVCTPPLLLLSSVFGIFARNDAFSRVLHQFLRLFFILLLFLFWPCCRFDASSSSLLSWSRAPDL
jgi:hypothetical protein